MSRAAALILLLIAVVLFLAVRRNIISNETIQQLVNVASIVSLLAAIMVFLIPSSPSDTENGDAGPNSQYSLHTDSRIPPAPPDVLAPTLTEEQLFPEGFGDKTGCYPEGNYYVVRLAKAGQDDYFATKAPYFYLINEKGVQEKYYLTNNLPNVVTSWLPTIMVPGRYLRVRFAYCGNGGFRFLTYIQPLNPDYK